MKKNLLIILGSFAIGGGETMVYELLKNIDYSRYNVSVLCYAGKLGTTLDDKVAKLNANIIYMNESGRITPQVMIRVTKKISELRPDIIHAHLGGMVFAVPWAFFNRNVSLIVTAHTKPQKAFNKKIEWLLRWELKHRKKTYVVGVSRENYKELLKYFDINDSKCGFINNGIDIDRFYSKPHDIFTFINVARQDKNKNQSMIITCFHKLLQEKKKIKLLLVGNGPEHLQLKEYVEKLGITEQVIFPGMVSNVEDYYAISDVYIQASFREAMPLSALEAMAAGLPIISTDVGGMKDIVKVNGTLILPGNATQMYEAMKALLNEGAEAFEMRRKKSLDLVNRYSSNEMAIQYMDLYKSLMEK